MGRALLLAMASMLLAGLLYAPVLGGEFQFDDQSSIVENAAVLDNRPAEIYLFWPGRYLVYQSFALQHALHGLDPRPYHLVNSLVHGLGAAFCGLWVYALIGPGVPARGRTLQAVLAAAFFLVHPIQTQAVSYVVQRAASLAACLALGSLAAHAFAVRMQASKRRKSLLVASWLAALAAMFCKEFAIVLPLAILLDDFLLAPSERRWRRMLPHLLLLPVVPLVAASGHAFGVAGSEGLLAETAKVSRLDYARTQFEAVARYLRLIVWPTGQNVDHDLPWHDDWERSALFALVPLCLIGATFWCAKRGMRLHAAALASFLIFMIPESSIFPIQDAMFEHRLYLPMASIALLFGASIAASRRGAVVGASIYLLVLAMATVHRNEVWLTPKTLWSDAVAKSPGKGRPHVALGVELARERDLDGALTELETGLRLQPDSARGWTNLGNVRLLKGDLAGARDAYERAVRIRPSHANAWYNLGVVNDRQGEWEEAGRCYERTLASQPEHTGALNALAAVRIRQGRPSEARRLAERAAALGAAAPAILERLR